MKREQLEAYLGRVGMEVPDRADLETLRQIQERHIYAVPVENLDIVQGRLPLSLEIDDLVEKVVDRHRGGISFELNLLLADALRDLGYGVRLMSARHPRYGSEFDHAFLMVDVPGTEGEWLVDVGFTECFRTPLLFDDRVWQGDGRDEYRLRRAEGQRDSWRLERRRGGEVELVYSFDPVEREVGDLAEQCAWFCTDPGSRFAQGTFVFIERPEGRVCLSMDTVTNTFTGEQLRPVIMNREEGAAALREIFGIETGQDGDGGADGKFGYRRVFAAIGDDKLQDAVIERAVGIALENKAHLRFGHIVLEGSREQGTMAFPAYVQAERARVTAAVVAKLAQMGVADDVYGGEVVVMGSNVRIGATIDAPVGYAPEQLVESLVKPFGPDIVVCGDRLKSRLRALIASDMGDYLSRKLDCEVVKVHARTIPLDPSDSRRAANRP